MRLGRVRIAHEYVVDLDNKEMVDHAKDALIEDMQNIAKYDEYHHAIEIDKDGHGLEESDIPDFLKEENEEWTF